MLNKIIRKLKTKTGMMYGIILLTSLVLGLSYGTFIFMTDGYKATEMLVSNLMYAIDISSTGGTETINDTSVSLKGSSTSTVLIKITSLNQIDSKYGLDYKITSGSGNIYYASSTGWLPSGKINKNGSGIYEKTIKVVISATSDMTVEFIVSGGYTYNNVVESKDTYTRVSEVYDNILSYTTNKLLSEVVNEETSDGLFGGDATNNYIQYPESTNVNENIWRIIGNYKSVGGIKLISNTKENVSVSDINTKLTNIYSTLTKTNDYVLSTNKFNCTGTTCTTSSYSNIGLLSSSEYNSDSYMNITDNWFTTNNSNVELVSGDNITSTSSSSTASLRASIYLQGDVSIKGSGTITDPYRLVEKGDVIISSATLNGTTLSYFPTMSSPYLVNSVSCSNGTTGKWDNKKDKIVLDNINLPTVCTVDFKDGYTVNLTSTGGNIPSSVQVGRSGTATITLNPADGYTSSGATTDCPNATISGNTLTINKIRSNISCSVILKMGRDYTTGSLAAKILSDNAIKKSRSDFKNTFSENTTGTVFQTNKTEDGSVVYYYAGKTENNWVKFGKYQTDLYSCSSTSKNMISTSCPEGYTGEIIKSVGDDMYWRIIRTNEDGSVRLLYSDSELTESTISFIGTGEYDETNVGYMYEIAETLEGERLNTTDSAIKTYIDNWYHDNLLINYDKYISKTAIYCNDRSIGEGTYSSLNSNFHFGSYIREVNQTPSYKCGDDGNGGLFETTQALADKFSASTESGGNGQLTYPIALITCDETFFIGSYDSLGTWADLNFIAWWTMSPIDSGFVEVLGPSDDPGDYNHRPIYYDGYGIRPVISIDKCAKVSGGDGTASNPYTIDENSCS